MDGFEVKMPEVPQLGALSYQIFFGGGFPYSNEYRKKRYSYSKPLYWRT